MKNVSHLCVLLFKRMKDKNKQLLKKYNSNNNNNNDDDNNSRLTVTPK